MTKTIIAVLLLVLSSLSFAQSNQDTANKVQAMVELAQEQQRRDVDQQKRDLILGGSRNSGPDVFGIILGISFVGFVGWKIYENNKEKKEIQIAVRKSMEEDRVKRVETREARDLEAEVKRKADEKIAYKKAEKLYDDILRWDEEEGLKNKLSLVVKTNQVFQSSSFLDPFASYACCFDKNKKIVSSYGVHSWCNNGTYPEDEDSKYDGIVFDWKVVFPDEDPIFPVIDIKANEFDERVVYVSVYFANGVNRDEPLTDFSVNVRLNGLLSKAETFEYSPSKKDSEALLHIGYFERIADGWKFNQLRNSKVDISEDVLQNGSKKEIFKAFQSAFVA